MIRFGLRETLPFRVGRDQDRDRRHPGRGAHAGPRSCAAARQQRKPLAGRMGAKSLGGTPVRRTAARGSPAAQARCRERPAHCGFRSAHPRIRRADRQPAPASHAPPRESRGCVRRLILHTPNLFDFLFDGGIDPAGHLRRLTQNIERGAANCGFCRVGSRSCAFLRCARRDRRFCAQWTQERSHCRRRCRDAATVA